MAALAETEAADVIEVWEDNRRPWLLFLDLTTQWRVAGMSGQVIGLDYQAALAVCRWRRIKPTPALFDDLRTLEAATLAVDAERHERR